MPWPPADTSTYCFPFGPRNVMGVERALVGNAPFHNSLPATTSNARMAGSSVPAMNTSPPAVTIGPPKPTEPKLGGAAGDLPSAGNCPRGTVHLISPVLASMALSVPHGGGLQGDPPGLRRNRRIMP